MWKKISLKMDLIIMIIMHVISLNEFSHGQNPKSNFPRVGVDEKHLMRFQSKNTVFKFSRRSVNLTKPQRERDRFNPMPVSWVMILGTFL